MMKIRRLPKFLIAVLLSFYRLIDSSVISDRNQTGYQIAKDGRGTVLPIFEEDRMSFNKFSLTKVGKPQVEQLQCHASTEKDLCPFYSATEANCINLNYKVKTVARWKCDFENLIQEQVKVVSFKVDCQYVYLEPEYKPFHYVKDTCYLMYDLEENDQDDDRDKNKPSGKVFLIIVGSIFGLFVCLGCCCSLRTCGSNSGGGYYSSRSNSSSSSSSSSSSDSDSYQMSSSFATTSYRADTRTGHASTSFRNEAENTSGYATTSFR